MVGWRRAGLGAAVAVCAIPVGARAQMVGVPVLQSAFTNPGVTVGANVATGDHATAYGVAAAWTPSARGAFQVSGGIGIHDADDGASHATWGLRAMAPIPALGTRTIGVGAFLGVGGLSARGGRETRVPVGVSVAYRRALGTHRAISAYITPLYSWTRLKQDTVSVSRGLFRVSVGVDVVVLPKLGVTLGYEGGSRARGGEPGPAGGLFGVGLSYALRGP